MAEEHNATHTDEDFTEKFAATLVRGEVHYLTDIRFDNGVPVVILAHHKEHLEEHAVDVVEDRDGETLVKDKFTFRPYNGNLDVGSIVGSKTRTDMDADERGSAARLQAFQAKELARKEQAKAPPPKFDPEARRQALNAETVRADDEEGEVRSAPRPRPRGRAA